MYQQCMIIGNVGQDSVLSYTNTGIAVCKFNVAVSKVTGKGEARKESTKWFRVTLWRERAENLSQYILKGTKIMVVGEIDVNAYTNKEGKPAASLELVANEVKLLSSRSDTAEHVATENDNGGIDNIPF